jgi:hypothetical protein
MSWAESVGQRYQEKEYIERLMAEKSVQDRRTLDAKGRLLWGELRAAIGKCCSEFNSTPGNRGRLSFNFQADTCKAFFTGQYRRIVGTFEGDTFAFRGNGGTAFDSIWKIKLTKDGLDVWLSDGNNSPVTVDEVAETIVEALLLS